MKRMIHRLVTVPCYKHLVSPFCGRRYCCQYTASASVYEKICTLCTVKCRCLSLRLLYNALSVVQIVKIVYLCYINSSSGRGRGPGGAYAPACETDKYLIVNYLSVLFPFKYLYILFSPEIFQAPASSHHKIFHHCRTRSRPV